MAVELLIVSLWLSLATLQRNGVSLESLMKEHSGAWLTVHFNNTMILWAQNAQGTLGQLCEYHRVVHPGPWFIPTGTPPNFRDVPVGTNLSLKSLVCWGSPSKLTKLERKKVSKSQNPHEQIVWCHAHENQKLWRLLKVCQLKKRVKALNTQDEYNVIFQFFNQEQINVIILTLVYEIRKHEKVMGSENFPYAHKNSSN